MTPIFVHGIDLSANHFAIVSLNADTGDPVSYAYADMRKKWDRREASMPFRFCHIQAKQTADKTHEEYVAERRHEVLEWVKLVLPSRAAGCNQYVNIEHYAMGAVSNSTYEIAEIGGLVREYFYLAGHYVRQTDPMSVKLYACGKGNATKQEIARAAWAHGMKIETDLFCMTGKDWSGPGTDIADAFWLSHMLYRELCLRSGAVTLESLPDNERRVFLRVTKAFPENVLARPFIHREPR